MMRRKEMNRLLEERAERIALLEQRLETQNQIVDTFKAREQAIVDTMSQARLAAERHIAEAQAKADALTKNAAAEVDALITQTRAQAEALVSHARAERDAMLAQTEKTVRAYEDKLAAYNADLDRSVAEVQATAARCAAFLKDRRVDTGELFNEVGGGAVMPAPAAETLPDPAGDPKTLMQNIYKLQQRDIPEPVSAPPELIDEIIADLGPRPAEVEEPAPEPEPERAPEPEPAPEPEWQPEPEPEWQPEAEPEGVPSVSELMPDAPEEEVSLDALLEEIIAAGDM